MAAEQLAILLWKHSMLKKNSKGKKYKEKTTIIDDLL